MKRSIICLIVTFSAGVQAAWIKSDQSGRKPSSNGELIGGWKFVDGEKGSLSEPREIRDSLAAQITDFSIPFCVRDELLRNEEVQAEIAVGNPITRIDFSSSVSSNEKYVTFKPVFSKVLGGHVPTANCKMK